MITVREVFDNLSGGVMIVATVLLRPLLQHRYRAWGATPDELKVAYPGDEAVPSPRVTQHLTVSVNAPASEVWPWVAQIGQERGGFYSYELLENIVGCQIHNAQHVVPEWELGVEDRVRLGRDGYPAHRVVGVDRGRWLLLAGADPRTGEVPDGSPGASGYVNQSWLLHLDQRPDGVTRLTSRSRLDFRPISIGQRVVWEWLTDPIGFVMTRKMLSTIARLAERSGGSGSR